MASSGDSTFTFKALIFGMSILILMPMMVGVFAPANLDNVDRDEVLDGYYQATGQTASPKTSVWVLTGIYLPYSGTSTYGYTDDGWLYGSEVKTYTPTQYLSTPQQYTVVKGSDGVFRYGNTNGTGGSADYDPVTGTGHKEGDLYTAVSFDIAQKSNIFFSESGKTEMDGYFYYQYDGYRMAFQPIASYTAINQDGERVPVVPTTTSLSLIWYQYYSAGGLSGNLVLSGSQSGISYLSSAQILSAFNSDTSSSTFKMVFNGITMDVTIRLNPAYLANGYDAEQVYNNGWWSIIVTSQSADSSAYTGTDYALNPLKLIQIMIDLFTFNYNDYNMSPWIGAVCSVIFTMPLYAMLLTLCLANKELWVLMGVMAALQGIAAAMSIFG